MNWQEHVADKYSAWDQEACLPAIEVYRTASEDLAGFTSKGRLPLLCACA